MKMDKNGWKWMHMHTNQGIQWGPEYKWMRIDKDWKNWIGWMKMKKIDGNS